MPVTILVAEDDPRIAALVATYLERAGHRVERTSSGVAAAARVKRGGVALLVLDVGLPDRDGFSVLEEVGALVPTIVLTARDEEADRVGGLRLGAEDYVTKPFSPRELVLRVENVLRRTRPTPALLRGRGVELDPAAREVRADGAPVELTPREFALLAHLLARAGTVVTREALLRDVWSYPEDLRTRTVEQHVQQVRRKLGREDVIATVRGVGFKAARPEGATLAVEVPA